ncbi:alpha-amylase [Streptomyces rhizosphaericus]|uniref:alpha-amylase n=1 Tax=Streptomyces rhizosphaericus TaxID=114699 RepID=UPI002548E9B8|nr:alpha-amylase [Streptomyces rhizosphaericus]
MQSWIKRDSVLAGVVTALILPLGLSVPAAAGDRTSGSAPACVAMYESWRYTNAANNCADTVCVMVVYQDGATSLCSTLPPGAYSTVGEGYLGRHGHPDHLAVCEPS